MEKVEYLYINSRDELLRLDISKIVFLRVKVITHILYLQIN